MAKVTAGRDYLGSIAPLFGGINDDVLFGQVWAREDQLSPRDRSLVTIAALMGAGILDESLRSHLATGLANGLTKAEIVEVVTQLAFYAGWPKSWAVFAMLGDIFAKVDDAEDEAKVVNRFGEHAPMPASENFTGRTWGRTLREYGPYSYYAEALVFEPGCRNSWHLHPKEQTLFVIQGRGWYVEDGREPRELRAGDVVNIPANTRHWHGAARDSFFEHVVTEDVTPDGAACEFTWLEPVADEEYDALP